MDKKVENKKQEVLDYFASAGARAGTTDAIKWMKVLLSDLIEAARLSVWEEVKACPECGEDTKLSRVCECGWWEES